MQEAAYLLLVEDNPGDARLTAELLADPGAASLPPLRWVQTADAAVDLLYREPGCAAVLLDLGLPDSCGLQSLHAVIESDPRLPIIVLTGDASELMGLDAVGCGAQDFLVKGRFDAVQLQRSIAFASQRKRAEVALVERSLRDDLTGLPRRALLMDRLQGAMKTSARSGAPCALLFVDLDEFKQVNDRLGHGAGDAVLKAVAERLVASVRASDTVARLGGDEFVLLLLTAAGVPDAVAVGHKVLLNIGLPMAVDGHSLRVSASIGVAMFAGLQESPGQLLERSDTAMYAAKAAGRGRVRLL